MPERLSLQSLPLFPLRTVLFPRGVLQLQIFEVRYLDLMRRCHQTGAPFGVVTLVEGSEVRQRDPDTAHGEGFAIESFVDTGTLATITERITPQPGLMVVRCVAGDRFRVQRSHQLKHGLWVADVQLIPPDPLARVPEDLLPVARALERVMHTLRARAAPEEHLPFAPPYRFDDCGWVANRWCELLGLEPHLRQGLMQLENPLLRLELVGDFLDKGGVMS